MAYFPLPLLPEKVWAIIRITGILEEGINSLKKNLPGNSNVFLPMPPISYLDLLSRSRKEDTGQSWNVQKCKKRLKQQKPLRLAKLRETPGRGRVDIVKYLGE